MRCIFGFVLFVALCYSGIQTLYVVATAYEANKTPGLSHLAAQVAGWKVAQKYHAYVYAVAGLITLGACSLPSLLGNHGDFNEEKEWRRMTNPKRR